MLGTQNEGTYVIDSVYKCYKIVVEEKIIDTEPRKILVEIWILNCKKLYELNWNKYLSSWDRL